METKATLKVVRTRVKRVLVYSMVENSLLSLLPWKQVANSILKGTIFLSLVILSYLSLSLADCWGTTVDFTTSFLHSSRFSAFRRSILHPRPVHSLMLSSHRFLCLRTSKKISRLSTTVFTLFFFFFFCVPQLYLWGSPLLGM